MIGRTIGKYRIVGQLGRGGAGVVYHAVDETLHRDVAIKTLNPDLANTEVMGRFRAEATILARLSHPQIATIFELFRNEGDLLMVMEFVRGEPLDKFSERVGPLSPERAAYLIDLILSALEHAHRAGVVHRDIKPANVMVTDEGGVKIMDFGIARVLGADHKTVDFRLMGTPAYMSPEQVLGEEVDGRSDLYSVGVLFYRLLTGALPFTSDTALGMLQRQIRDTPLPLEAHRAGLPDWCGHIISKALAKSPAERFQSAEEFREAMARVTGSMQTADLAKIFTSLNREVASASADAAGARTVDLSRHNINPAPRVHDAVAARPKSSKVGWVPAAAAVLMIMAAAVGYFVLREAATEAAVPSAPVVAGSRPTAPESTPAAPTVADEPRVADLAVVADEPRAVTPPVEKPKPAEPPQAPKKIEAAPRPSRSAPPPEPARSLLPPPSPDPVATVAPPVAVVEKAPAPPVVPAEPSLVFETRAFVGTRKPKEQGAQLVLGDGKITIIPQDDPTTPLCSFPYTKVVSLSVSRSRDPLWNSPQGPAPVARAGGMISRLGIQVSRDWITMRTNTEEQFVAMRFDEVLMKRVLLALEERTGRTSQFVELPKN